MKYDLIYTDPPWWYNSRKTLGESNNKTKFGGGAEKHYPLMKNIELLNMCEHINNISEKNAIMFMRVTMPRLDFGIELMQYRGFKYKTVAFTWVKINNDGSYRINPGYYTASNAELVILGIKGKNNGRFKPQKTMINQIVSEHIQAHSKKPDIVRTRIDQMYPHLKKIEMFAREKIDGWDAWGNEVE